MALVVKIERNVYIKIVLHASKYPSFPVIGFLLGNEENNEVIVSNLFPIFHSSPLGPLFDIALLSVREQLFLSFFLCF